MRMLILSTSLYLSVGCLHVGLLCFVAADFAKDQYLGKEAGVMESWLVAQVGTSAAGMVA